MDFHEQGAGGDLHDADPTIEGETVAGAETDKFQKNIARAAVLQDKSGPGAHDRVPAQMLVPPLKKIYYCRATTGNIHFVVSFKQHLKEFLLLIEGPVGDKKRNNEKATLKGGFRIIKQEGGIFETRVVPVTVTGEGPNGYTREIPPEVVTNKGQRHEGGIFSKKVKEVAKKGAKKGAKKKAEGQVKARQAIISRNGNKLGVCVSLNFRALVLAGELCLAKGSREGFTLGLFEPGSPEPFLKCQVSIGAQTHVGGVPSEHEKEYENHETQCKAVLEAEVDRADESSRPCTDKRSCQNDEACEGNLHPRPKKAKTESHTLSASSESSSSSGAPASNFDASDLDDVPRCSNTNSLQDFSLGESGGLPNGLIDPLYSSDTDFPLDFTSVGEDRGLLDDPLFSSDTDFLLDFMSVGDNDPLLNDPPGSSDTNSVLDLMSVGELDKLFQLEEFEDAQMKTDS